MLKIQSDARSVPSQPTLTLRQLHQTLNPCLKFSCLWLKIHLLSGNFYERKSESDNPGRFLKYLSHKWLMEAVRSSYEVLVMNLQALFLRRVSRGYLKNTRIRVQLRWMEICLLNIDTEFSCSLCLDLFETFRSTSSLSIFRMWANVCVQILSSWYTSLHVHVAAMLKFDTTEMETARIEGRLLQ